jgi:hypothetical protein
VRIRLGSEVLEIPLLFVDSETAPRVLGREGVFDHFTIIFEETKHRTGFLGTGSTYAQTMQNLLDQLHP